MASDDLLREAGDPNTSTARLQEIAQLDQSTWSAIAANPAAYDGLLDWLGQHGDETVKAAIAARAAAAPPVPPVPPAAPAPPVPATVAAPAVPPVPSAAPAVPTAVAAPAAAPGAVGVAAGYPLPPKKSNTGLIVTIVALVAALLIGGGIWLFLALSGGSEQAQPNEPGTGQQIDPGTGQQPVDPGQGAEQPQLPQTPVSGDVCQQLVTATMQWGQQNQHLDEEDAMASIGGLYKAWGDGVSDPQLKSDMYLIADMMQSFQDGDYTKFVNNSEADAAMERMSKTVEDCGDAFSAVDGLGNLGF